jgi:O-antigen ligase
MDGAAVTGTGGARVAPRLRAVAGTAALPFSVAWMGVGLLLVLAPFETVRPLIVLPGQSISSVEALLLAIFLSWLAAAAYVRVLPIWRTPLTLPWVVFLAAMGLAALLAGDHRANALNMVGRLGLAFGVYLLTVNALQAGARRQAVAVVALSVGLAIAGMVLLDFFGVRPVRSALAPFREQIAFVGAQVRASGPFQYPTISSMYLEVLFALALPLIPIAMDERRPRRALAVLAGLALIGEAIALTFTRAGLVTMASSLALVGGLRYRQHGFDRSVRAIAGLGLAIGVLFVGSHSFESVRLRLTSEGTNAWFRAAVSAPLDVQLATGSRTSVRVALTNTGRATWDSTAPQPFFLSYHWLLADEDRVVSWEGLRTPFPGPVAPGESVVLDAAVEAPGQPGRYRLQWDVEQQHRLWFSTEAGAARFVSRATVSGPATDHIATLGTRDVPQTAERPGRLVLWRTAARLFAASPIVGVGPDNFRLLYGPAAGLANADRRVHSNNVYLEVLVGGGLLAGVAFVWLGWRSAGCLVPALRAMAHRGAVDRPSAATAGAAAAMLAIGLHGLVDSFVSFTPTYVLFAITLGAAASYDLRTRSIRQPMTRAEADADCI